MPTENRSSNTEMVNVPRDKLQAWQERFSKAQIFRESSEVQALLAQPAEQHQGEPVGYQQRTMTDRPGSQWTPWRECCDATRARYSQEVGQFNQHGIMREIRPVFASAADPGEVERLQFELSEARAIANGQTSLRKEEAEDWAKERDTLRAQLAERDELLQQALQVGGLTQEWHDKVAYLSPRKESGAPKCKYCEGRGQVCIDWEAGAWEDCSHCAPVNQSLVECDACPRSGGCVNTCMKAPASAEQSAPVERDERAKFVAWWTNGVARKVPDTDRDAETGWAAWQARAALERKP